MKNKISLEYAEALFLLATEENRQSEYLGDMQMLKGVIEENGEYLLLLSSPAVSLEEKEALIDGAFGAVASEHTVSFLKLLCLKGRAELLPMCIEDFVALYNKVNRVIRAEVTSAVELTDSEKEKIIEKLSKKTGHRVELLCRVDKSILGGVIISTEDAVMDGSLKQKISDVKEVIKGESKA